MTAPERFADSQIPLAPRAPAFEAAPPVATRAAGEQSRLVSRDRVHQVESKDGRDVPRLRRARRTASPAGANDSFRSRGIGADLVDPIGVEERWRCGAIGHREALARRPGSAGQPLFQPGVGCSSAWRASAIASSFRVASARSASDTGFCIAVMT